LLPGDAAFIFTAYYQRFALTAQDLERYSRPMTLDIQRAEMSAFHRTPRSPPTAINDTASGTSISHMHHKPMNAFH